MSRASSRLSQRYHRPQTGLNRRPKSVAGFYHDTDVIFEEDDLPRPYTSFHYYPEELEDSEEGPVGDAELGDTDYANHPNCQAWSVPQDPEPLKLAKKYGYGYRKPTTELSPHWSQWPQPPKSDTAQLPLRRRNVIVPTPPPPHVAKNHCSTQYAVYEPVTDAVPSYCNATMAMRTMSYGNYGDRNIIMHRGLSPRRAAPPMMPRRSLTHYGSFGNRENSSRNINCMDLYSTTYNQGCGSRQSRPMHRHLVNAGPDEGYMHNHSIYYSTTPNVSGYFIIHPDWVSERLSMKRSRSLLSF